MPIVALYAALLGLILFFLIISVIRLRWRHRVSLGDAGNAQLQTAIRAHGNFTEIVPFALVLMVVLAQLHGGIYLLHTIGILLVVGRCVHAYSLLNVKLVLRPVGMALGTFTPLLLGVIGCFYYAL
jgi:uncharacterized membrane protein YecN with MAPEG domain